MGNYLTVLMGNVLSIVMGKALDIYSWIYSPACNLYVVYNDGRLVGPGRTEIANRTLMLKVTYFWRR